MQSANAQFGKTMFLAALYELVEFDKFSIKSHDPYITFLITKCSLKARSEQGLRKLRRYYLWKECGLVVRLRQGKYSTS